jgi:hypothetical protein
MFYKKLVSTLAVYRYQTKNKYAGETQGQRRSEQIKTHIEKLLALLRKFSGHPRDQLYGRLIEVAAK